MSTLWTPGGERPVGRPEQEASPAAQPAATGAETEGDARSREEMEADLAELQRQLASTPAAVVVTNHCFGLFELAALHLSLQPPQLGEAGLAIDALGAIVEGLPGRLGDHEQDLRDALAQLRLAFVQISAAAKEGEAPPPG